MPSQEISDSDIALNKQYVEGASECINRTAGRELEYSEARYSKNSSSIANSLNDYRGNESTSDEQNPPEKLGDLEGAAPLQKLKTGYFSPRLKSHRRRIIEKFVLINFVLGAFCIAILSIYWGATYKRDHYFFKVNVLAVIQDQSDLVNTTMSAIIPTLIGSVPCTWHIYNSTTFTDRYDIATDQIGNRIIELIHSEKYWMALNVKPNATNALYDSLTGGPAAFNSTDYFDAIFEGGRDPTTVISTIVPNMEALRDLYSEYFDQEYLPQLLANISNTVSIQRVIAASNINFNYVDNRPFPDYILLSPLQVGLIYCLLLTFFQLSLYAPLHMEMAQLLKPRHMLFYRIGISWLTYFFLSLFFCTVSAVFQIDFTRAFGRGGFIVYWMSSWLLMMALGGANENMISLILVVGPQYLGFWLMLWIILNISCSFYPLVLNNEFYRYGYAMPIHNAVDIFKVIFLDLSKHKMGRNYGILVAWVALNTAVFPFVMKFVSLQMQKKREAAATQK